MNEKRQVLAKLGWSSEMINAFLESDVGGVIEIDAPTAAPSVHAYADQSNVMVQLASATILSGYSVRAKAKKNSARPRAARRAG